MGDQHRDRLTEHGGFGFDSADAPAQYSKAVDHRRVRIGADYRVGIRAPCAIIFGVENDPTQVFQVDLMHDARVWGHDAEILESGLAPAQERVALLVTLEFDLVVQVQRVGGAVVVDLHGMIDDQFCRRQGIDPVGRTAQFHDGVAHRGEIDHGWHTGKILQDDTARRKRNFGARICLRVPVGQRENVIACDVAAVLVAQQVLQQDLEGVGKFGHVAFAHGVEAKNLVVIAADSQRRACTEGILHVSFSGNLLVGRDRSPAGWRIIANAA